MITILGIGAFTTIILFSYSACVISGRCSKEEEKENINQQIQ